MRIRWTKPAVADLTHISDYTEEHFGEAQAHRAALAIYEAADSLITLPLRGRHGRKPDILANS
jgi:plasmid stabilization system protein ParE